VKGEEEKEENTECIHSVHETRDTVVELDDRQRDTRQTTSFSIDKKYNSKIYVYICAFII